MARRDFVRRGLGVQSLDEGYPKGNDRNGEQSAHDAGDDGTDSNAEQHDERMNGNGLAQQEGLQDVSLNLHDGHENDKHDEGLEESKRHQHHADGDDTSRQRTDNGDEGQDECQSANRH